jgi:archaemetzincin
MRKNEPFIFILLLLFFGCSKPETANRTELQDQNPVVETKKQSPISAERALKLLDIKDSVAPFFSPMPPPQESDWLASFPETGQTFEEYINGSPTLPTPERQTIYIQPMGEFTASQRKILNRTAEYMKAFYNLPVKLNPPVKLVKVPKEMSRENPFDRQKQIKTGYFLDDLLPKMLPEDAAAFICFTNYDLYPDENWNYVFGQATLQNRVGVWSLWRFGNADKSAEDYKKFLARTLKVAMHETGHMFSMLHCTKYECLMSGTNHLGETDRRPLDVCPECMAKIAWAFDYEPSKRYRNLADFWKQEKGWTDEEKLFIQKAEAVEKALK